MAHQEVDGRHSLHFGASKINIHTTPGQFQPAASTPVPGSIDMCLETVTAPAQIAVQARAAGATIIEGPVCRHGARGTMTSVYLRAPDGNLIEIACYPRG